MCQVRADNDKYEKLKTIIREYSDKFSDCDFGQFGGFAVPRDDALSFMSDLKHIGVDFYGYFRIRIDEAGQWHNQMDGLTDDYFEGTLEQLYRLSFLNIEGGKSSDVYHLFFDGGPLTLEDFADDPSTK